MIIESSDVQTKAQTFSELNSKAKTSFDFKQSLLGFVSKEGEPLKNIESLNEVDEKIENIQDKISSLILELILLQFLGVNPNKKQNQSLNKICSKLDSKDDKSESNIMVMKTDYNYERVIEYSKIDKVEYSSKAIIKTKDKDIEIDLNIAYSKEFYEKHEEKIEFSELKYIDPIVIQYDKKSNSLDFLEDELTFTFDLDLDGEKDEISKLKEGNGFLALDKNSNGIIDDGSELFGPNTNDGFEELREFDDDKNGWIDENDTIFNNLRVWTKDKDGKDKLFALGDSEIGAIYLKDNSTEIDINKSVKESLAHLKSTSFFVREDGSAGLLSSFDYIARS